MKFFCRLTGWMVAAVLILCAPCVAMAGEGGLRSAPESIAVQESKGAGLGSGAKALAIAEEATPLAAPAIAVAQSPAQAHEAALLAWTNLLRAQAGLCELQIDDALTEGARIRAREIPINWSHIRPDGSQWHTVVAPVGAENLAKGQRDAQEVADGWMTSPGHMQNILNPDYGWTGVAFYEQNGMYYWVQLYR